MLLIYSLELSFNIIPEHIDDFLPDWHELNFCCGRNRALAIATLHEQPFPLPYYIGIIAHKDAASAIQT
jgi:hypothetical protein